MKKYVTSKKVKPFNWNRFLNRKTYNEPLLDEVSNLALNWVTCACGNQCDIIPRNNYGCPIDGILATLGGEFGHNLVNMYHNYADNKTLLLYRNKAIKTLAKIENRSAYLIQKEFKNKKVK